MASFGQALHEWVNAQSWAPGVIQFDVQPLKPPYPYYTMVPIGDDGARLDMCASDEGQTIIQFNGYGTDRYELYEAMDALRANLWQARNDIPDFRLWNVTVTGVTGYGTEEIRVYRYSLEMTNIWEVL